jgi:ankyrin repeat protein
MPSHPLLSARLSRRSRGVCPVAAGLLLGSSLLCFSACDTGKSGTVDARLVFPDSSDARLADAVARDDSVLVRKLVAAGADPNARGDKGVTLLHWAVLNKSKHALSALLADHADVKISEDGGETVVHWAAMANDPQYLTILLSHRVDPDTRNTITSATPLMSALMGNRDVQFHALLKARAKPDLADRFDNTALHLAGKIYAYQRILDLLNAGADPTLKNRQGMTFQYYLDRAPMDILSEEGKRGREAVAAWLRGHGVKPEFETGRGRRANNHDGVAQ